MKVYTVENIGGLSKFFYTAVENIAGFGDLIDGVLQNIALVEGAQFIEVDLNNTKSNFRIVEKSRNLYEHEYFFVYPEDDVYIQGISDAFSSAGYVLIVFDNNGKARVIGEPGNGVIFRAEMEKGEGPTALNNVLFKFAWTSGIPAPFYGATPVGGDVPVPPAGGEYKMVLKKGIDGNLYFDWVYWDEIQGKPDITADLDAHLSDYDNPHQVTKAQVGLANVENVKQIPYSEKGVANGVATLGASGKIPSNQFPAEIMSLKGLWNAATNTPILADGTGDQGDVWIVSVQGTQDLGHGEEEFFVNDWAIYLNNVWEHTSNAHLTKEMIEGLRVDDSPLFKNIKISDIAANYGGWLGNADDDVYDFISKLAAYVKTNRTNVTGDGTTITAGGVYGTLQAPAKITPVYGTQNWYYGKIIAVLGNQGYYMIKLFGLVSAEGNKQINGRIFWENHTQNNSDTLEINVVAIYYGVTKDYKIGLNYTARNIICEPVTYTKDAITYLAIRVTALENSGGSNIHERVMFEGEIAGTPEIQEYKYKEADGTTILDADMNAAVNVDRDKRINHLYTNNLASNLVGVMAESGILYYKKYIGLITWANTTDYESFNIYFKSGKPLPRWIRLIILSSFTNVNNTGMLSKIYNLVTNGLGTITGQSSFYDQVSIYTGANTAISDIAWDAANSRYYITVYKTVNTSRNTLRCIMEAGNGTIGEYDVYIDAAPTSLGATPPAIAAPIVQIRKGLEIGGSTNYTKLASDGYQVMEGTAQPIVDVNFSVMPRFQGSGLPTYKTRFGNYKGYAWAVGDLVPIDPEELFHSLAPGTIAKMHIHFSTGNAVAPASNTYVKWRVELSGVQAKGSAPYNQWSAAVNYDVEVMIPANLPANSQLSADFPDVTLPAQTAGYFYMMALSRITSTGTAFTGDIFPDKLQMHGKQKCLGTQDYNY